MREGLEDARGGAVAATADGAVELAVVGADPSDASALLLRAADGRTFRLPVDGRLRAAVRSAGPVSAPTAAVGEPLRPRDIQARIRAGESAADVAADAGVPLEQVRRYEGPVLAERAHIASLARLAVVRGGPGRTVLEEAVRTRLLARGSDPGTAAWDAWRRDGGWAVQVSFRAAGRDRSAQWSFSPGNRVLEPLDDEARWLTAPPDDQTGRRLAAVRVYDVETDDGGVDGVPAEGPPAADALDPGPEPHPARAPQEAHGQLHGASAEPTGGDGAAADGAVDGPGPEDPDDDLASRTLDLLDALRDRRGRRVPLDVPPDGAPWDDDEEDDDLLNALLDLPPGSHPDSAELQEEVDRARARLRMVTPPRGLSLGGATADGGAGDVHDGDGPDTDTDTDGTSTGAGGTGRGDGAGRDGGAAPAARAALGLVPPPPPTAPQPVTPVERPARTLSAAPAPDGGPDGGTEVGTEGDLDGDLLGRGAAPAGPWTRRAARDARDADPADDGHDGHDAPAAVETPAAGAPAAGGPAEHDGDDPDEQPAKRRRSVPSWDEIVFGVPRRD